MTELGLLEAGREALPFQLTGGQDLALNNILRDMQGPLPMMCLLQVPPQRQRGPKPGFMPIHFAGRLPSSWHFLLLLSTST